MVESASVAHREVSGVLRRLHALSGVVPLGLFLLFHAWQQAPVHAGRDALLHRLEATTHGWLEIVLVALPLFFHAGSGLWLANKRDSGPARYASGAFRRFQWFSGLAVAAFLLSHLLGVWRPLAEFGRGFSAYNALWDQTATLPRAAGYVVGISATCVHFGQGVSVALLRLVPTWPVRAARLLGGLLGLGLWLVFIGELAVYATGASLM